jgi:hypothetical protein
MRGSVHEDKGKDFCESMLALWAERFLCKAVEAFVIAKIASKTSFVIV